MNMTRILAFKNKPPTHVEFMPQDYASVHQSKPVKPRKHIRQVIPAPLSLLSGWKSRTCTVTDSCAMVVDMVISLGIKEMKMQRFNEAILS
ncbi:uncharacterized protein [Spinacia oleracea]|uniref:Uncharacterized protein isoform X3 n=1 Tax=Spinacia oleracea TaxID=3562 RepID=A0ABM3QNJ6_SPIOL|nr:uncharacterized protein LOC130461053 isoform X3 [Spinacia oleracea]